MPFNFMALVTVHSDSGTQENKSVTVSPFHPSICHEVMGSYVMILVFWMLSFRPAFSFPSRGGLFQLFHPYQEAL